MGIVADNQIVALRPVPVISADLQPLTSEYALQEYGVSVAELVRFKRRQARANAAARRRGKVITFKGVFDDRVLD